ncbi:MAG TPA: carbon monoxide dehydrogenase subunit G [Gemmatimonadales bacterium]|jgi:carbon monoxide dehydrogenase subunit G|nr:carbon monoxide dehydrogenase subunit G [Gemmatimonadales bacterium]
MKFQFSGDPVITAPRQFVWDRLTDPDFIAASAPGVESVQALDPTHFTVMSGLGLGPMKVKFTLDVELFDVVERESLRMRSLARGPGSVVDVLSVVRLEDAQAGTRLNWSATSDVSGTLANLGPRMIEGAARMMSDQFWSDFARRVGLG